MDTISRHEKPNPMTRIFESPVDPFVLGAPPADEVQDASPIHTAHTQPQPQTHYPIELLKHRQDDDSKLNLLVMRPPGSSHGGSNYSDISDHGERRPRTARTDVRVYLAAILLSAYHLCQSYSSRPLPTPRPRTAGKQCDKCGENLFVTSPFQNNVPLIWVTSLHQARCPLPTTVMPQMARDPKNLGMGIVMGMVIAMCIVMGIASHGCGWQIHEISLEGAIY